MIVLGWEIALGTIKGNNKLMHPSFKKPARREKDRVVVHMRERESVRQPKKGHDPGYEKIRGGEERKKPGETFKKLN